MSKGPKKEKVSETPLRYAMSRQDVAALFAVEGLKLSPEGEQRLKETEGMSPEERIAVVIAVYKAKAVRGADG